MTLKMQKPFNVDEKKRWFKKWWPENVPYNTTFEKKTLNELLDDLADISGYLGGGIDDDTSDLRGAIYHGDCNILDNLLTGDTTYQDGIYFKTSGEYPPDSSTSLDENDAELWFYIKDS